MKKLIDLIDKTKVTSDITTALNIPQERRNVLAEAIINSIEEDSNENDGTVCTDRVLSKLDNKIVGYENDQELYFISMAIGKVMEMRNNPFHELINTLKSNN